MSRLDWIKLLLGYTVPLGLLAFLLASNLFMHWRPTQKLLSSESIYIKIELSNSDSLESSENIIVEDDADFSQLCADHNYQLGKKAYEDKKYSEALKIWSNAEFKDCPQSLKPFLLAKIYSSMGMYTKAYAFNSESIQKDTAWPSSRIARALISLKESKFTPALSDLRVALQLGPRNSTAWYHIGLVWLKMGKLDSARFAFSESLLFGAPSDHTWHNLGVIFQKKQMLDSAKFAYEKAIRLNPSTLPSRYNLALLYQREKNKTEAFKIWESILKINPSEILPRIYMARYAIREKKYTVAIQYIQEILVSHPGNLDANYELGKVYGLQGKDKEALSIYRKIASEDAGNPRVHYNIGVNLMDLGKEHDAEVSYLKCLQSDPMYWKASYNLGVYYLKHGDLSKAKHMLLRTIESNESHLPSLYNIGIILLKQNKEKEAIDYFSICQNIDSTHLESLYNLAYAQLELEKYDSAKINFNRLTHKSPENPKVYFNLGLIARRQNDFKTAISYFQKASKLQPHYSEAWYNMALCFRDNKDYKKALLAVDSSLNNKTSHMGSHLLKAELLAYTGDSSTARSELRVAAKTQYANIKDLKRLKIRMLDMQMTADAEELLSSMVQMDSSLVKEWSQLASIKCRNQEYEIASIYFLKAIHLREDDPAIWKKFSECLYDAKQIGKAISAAESGLTYEPSRKELRRNLAKYYFESKLYKKSYEEYLRVYKLSDKSSDLEAATNSLLQLGDANKALKTLHPLLSDKTPNAKTMELAIKIYQALGQSEKAEKWETILTNSLLTEPDTSQHSK